ncbi:MAG: cytochrome b [Proteobacteria bacterium]|uniref:cytochrome b n=1 Tax=Aquabacterium sp. TaxID=1872578 RepID=UPI0035C78617|nr:cytochrome b [Pseudomonadota bacterium]
MTTQARYTRTAMLLHWVLALAILGAFAMGLYVHDLPFSPAKLKLINWHKWAGVTILALSLLRLVWRLTHRPPALPTRIEQAMPAWQRAAHHGTHHLMYLLFFAVPLLGWAYSSAKGYPIVWFGVLPLPDLVSPDPALAEALQPLHALAAWGLIGLAVLHVAAALKHQFIDRDGLIDRMRPGR